MCFFSRQNQVGSVSIGSNLIAIPSAKQCENAGIVTLLNELMKKEEISDN